MEQHGTKSEQEYESALLPHAQPWVPADKRKLRACTGCNMIKTERQWKEAGCENGCFASITGNLGEFTEAARNILKRQGPIEANHLGDW